MQFHPVVAAIAVSTLAFPAIAQTVVVAPVPPVDLTAVAVAAVGALLTIVGAVATAQINARMKDKQAAATLTAALANAQGAMKQALDEGIRSSVPQIKISGTMAVGVQYMVDHAGEEMARFGITPEAIADKLNAKLGVAKLAADPTLPVKA